MAQTTARTDIGFKGGQSLALRTTDDAYDKLMAALADDKSDRWHSLESEDENIQIDLAQVIYVRRESGTRSVGF